MTALSPNARSVIGPCDLSDDDTSDDSRKSFASSEKFRKDIGGTGGFALKVLNAVQTRATRSVVMSLARPFKAGIKSFKH